MPTSKMRVVREAGTDWPVPHGWEQVGERVFQGPGGLLKLFLGDGELIDPGRCWQAQESRPAGWGLVSTKNGVGMTGTYVDSGADVVVYVVHADCADVEASEGFDMPEVQATYVISPGDSGLAQTIRASLDCRPLTSTELGLLDTYGHAAMGPVPLLDTWLPVGDFIDNTGRLREAPKGKAYVMLVGGGWLMFADEAKCCGALLEPLPWRTLDHVRALERLNSELRPRGLSVQTEHVGGARVWQCQMGGGGLWYSARDEQGHLGSKGAFWTDPFGQTWRLHYWFHPAHWHDADGRLAEAAPFQHDARQHRHQRGDGDQ